VILLERVTHSAAETEALGHRLGERLDLGSVWLLTGELGAGKTVFVRGICRGLGVQGRVRSPSFTLVTNHMGRLPVVHVDLYRLERQDEIVGLGWEDLAADGTVLLVEWGERARPLVGADRFEAELQHLGGDRRLIRLRACGVGGEAMGREILAGLATLSLPGAPVVAPESASSTAPRVSAAGASLGSGTQSKC
jgi:tRNA threonylcarbamoyladenosine biosynthesis protein TsaE